MIETTYWQKIHKKYVVPAVNSFLEELQQIVTTAIEHHETLTFEKEVNKRLADISSNIQSKLAVSALQLLYKNDKYINNLSIQRIVLEEILSVPSPQQTANSKYFPSYVTSTTDTVSPGIYENNYGNYAKENVIPLELPNSSKPVNQDLQNTNNKKVYKRQTTQVDIDLQLKRQKLFSTDDFIAQNRKQKSALLEKQIVPLGYKHDKNLPSKLSYDHTYTYNDNDNKSKFKNNKNSTKKQQVNNSNKLNMTSCFNLLHIKSNSNDNISKESLKKSQTPQSLTPSELRLQKYMKIKKKLSPTSSLCVWTKPSETNTSTNSPTYKMTVLTNLKRSRINENGWFSKHNLFNISPDINSDTKLKNVFSAVTPPRKYQQPTHIESPPSTNPRFNKYTRHIRSLSGSSSSSNSKNNNAYSTPKNSMSPSWDSKHKHSDSNLCTECSSYYSTKNKHVRKTNTPNRYWDIEFPTKLSKK